MKKELMKMFGLDGGDIKASAQFYNSYISIIKLITALFFTYT